MSNLENKINETFDYAVYLHMMSNFVPNTNIKQIEKTVKSIHDFLKSLNELFEILFFK